MLLKDKLERLYEYYNARKWVHPDPLEFLYNFPDMREREIVGLIASSLAYGRVSQILKSVSIVLKRMGPSPLRFLESSSPASLLAIFKDFRHRFTSGEDLAMMLIGTKKVIEKYGSLYECFQMGMEKEDKTILSPLSFLVQEIRNSDHKHRTNLLPFPEKGSACKKLNLFLRWMVRKDNVDPGGWDNIRSSRLIIPLDTHMYRICSLLDLTCRKSADMQTALEITQAFKEIVPEDPVKYDFALTRLGIREDSDMSFLI